jgi:LacI family transcriptional regulator, gluconate utilization system Gnt-I transcriptional repressor
VVEMWDHQRGRHEFAQVGFSHAAVGQAMARHLIDRGHRRLAYVDTPVADDVRAHERGDAFVREARRDGAQVELLPTSEPDAFDAGRAVLERLIAAPAADAAALAASRPRRTSPTALAFANDHIAAGALLHARRIGIDVPGDLALLGFGDFPIARQLDPPLSTVRPPRHEIGVEAARQVVVALRDGRPAVGCALDWELVLRGTT